MLHRGSRAGLVYLSALTSLLWLLSMAVAQPGHGQAATAAVNAAAALVRAGHYSEAVAEAERALKAHPGDPFLRTVEGVAYSLEGKDAEALGALHAALHGAPGFLPALKAEAQILSRRHDAEAVPVLARILQANPQDSTAREMLAVEQARGNRCGEAIENFDQVQPALTHHAESLARYGACLFEKDRFAEAAAIFAEVVALQPANEDARYDLALAQSRAGRNKDAVDTLKPMLDQADVETLLLASDVFEDIGDTPQAVSAMRRAIVKDPVRAESYVRFAELCMLHESYQPGIDVVSAGIARMPQAASLFLARGMLYGGLAQYDKAEADFRSAELLDPHHGTGSYGVGLVQAQSNHADQALATVRAGLRVHPDDAQLNFLLARMLVEGGAQPGVPSFTEAAAAATTAVHLNPELVAARDLLAKIYGMQGQTAPEIDQYKAALRLDPSDQIALYRLMRATRQSGDTAAADALVRQIEAGHKQAREEESHRMRYRIEEASGPTGPGTGGGQTPAHP